MFANFAANIGQNLLLNAAKCPCKLDFCLKKGALGDPKAISNDCGGFEQVSVFTVEALMNDH
jgi:hypothetical protein